MAEFAAASTWPHRDVIRTNRRCLPMYEIPALSDGFRDAVSENQRGNIGNIPTAVAISAAAVAADHQLRLLQNFGLLGAAAGRDRRSDDVVRPWMHRGFGLSEAAMSSSLGGTSSSGRPTYDSMVGATAATLSSSPLSINNITKSAR